MSCVPLARVAEPRLSGADASALDLALGVLRPLLACADLTELCVNRPGTVFIETAAGWCQQGLPAADYAWCVRFAKLVANSTCQRVDETAPLLTAWLPSGERVQVVLPPATSAGCVAISIRRPADTAWSVRELAARGALLATRRAAATLDDTEQELLRLLVAEQHEAFLRLAVRSRRNILVSGPTGSGKTTWTKALIREIPTDERLVTIEDTRELTLDLHPNHVRLFYSKDDQGLARVKPKQLLESCLRMRPDRILLAELRAEEAFEYLRSVNSGHPGSITSIHAASAALAFEQLVMLIKQSGPGRDLARADIKSLLYSVVDVVIQCGLDQHRRFIQEIWYEPHRRLQLAEAS